MRLSVISVILVIAALVITTVALSHAHDASRDATAPGSVQFSLSANFPTIGSFPSGIVSGDFNNDGIPDLAVVSSHAGYIAVALGKGDGTFGPWLNTLSTYAPYVVAAGILNGKNLDVVVGDLDFGNALAMFGDGTGNFPTSTALSTNNHMPGGIVVGDFNGDGNNDLAITDTSSVGHVYVFLGNGDGTFQQGKKFITGGYDPTEILARDFNGDGILDLAVVNALSGGKGSVAVLIGRGTGGFDPPLVYRFPKRDSYLPSAFAIEDFNNDKRLDLAVAFSDYTSQTPGYVRVLLGNGDGTFQKGVLLSVGQEPNWVASADFNGDGNADLVVANGLGTVDGEISVLAGNGDGTFQPRVKFSVGGDAPVQLTVADFNGDGKPDVATVNADNGGTISVLLNTTRFPTSRHTSSAAPRP